MPSFLNARRLAIAAVVLAAVLPYVPTLDNYFAPVLPHRVGTITPDAPGTFRANALCPTTCASAITIMYVPNTNSQTSIRTDTGWKVGAAHVSMMPAP